MRRAAEQESFLRQVRGLPCLCFQRKASRCWDQGRWAAGLAEVCIESSADDQPPHLTGPSSDLVQFGISKKAAHGEVIDVAISTCEADVGKERTALKAGGECGSKQTLQDH